MKTTETSVEKHTVIEGGNVTTTVHETECVDGEITKDDVVQVKSPSSDKPALVSGESIIRFLSHHYAASHSLPSRLLTTRGGLGP